MSDDAPPEAYLVLTTETGQHEVHRVDRRSMILGRGAGSDLLLTNPQVSRRHAELTWDGQLFLLQDLAAKTARASTANSSRGPRLSATATLWSSPNRESSSS